MQIACVCVYGCARTLHSSVLQTLCCNLRPLQALLVGSLRVDKTVDVKMKGRVSINCFKFIIQLFYN